MVIDDVQHNLSASNRALSVSPQAKHIKQACLVAALQLHCALCCLFRVTPVERRSPRSLHYCVHNVRENLEAK